MSSDVKFIAICTLVRVRDLDMSLNFYTRQPCLKSLCKEEFTVGKFFLAFMGFGPEENYVVIELAFNWDQVPDSEIEMIAPTATGNKNHKSKHRRD